MGIPQEDAVTAKRKAREALAEKLAEAMVGLDVQKAELQQLKDANSVREDKLARCIKVTEDYVKRLREDLQGL